MQRAIVACPDTLKSSSSFPSLALPSKELIKQIIALGQKTFINGPKSVENFQQKATSDPSFAENVAEADRSLFPRLKDSRFVRDANLIPGTPFIASAGPWRQSVMAEFIADTVYNSHVEIGGIVAIGLNLGYSDLRKKDFYDYCLKERKEVYGSYTVTTRRESGECVFSPTGSQVFVEGAVETELAVQSTVDGEQDKTIPVFVFKAPDGEAIDFVNDPDNINKLTLLKVFQLSQQKNILIHCASGVGRTGYLILLLEILKNFSEIFSSNNPEVINQKINDIVVRIRGPRPALVYEDSQYGKAIYDACVLQGFTLRKKLVEEARLSTRNVFTINEETEADFQSTISNLANYRLRGSNE